MHRDGDGTHQGRFGTEADLGPIVERWLQAEGSICIGREVEVGFGVPDLVGGFGSRASLRNRKRRAGPVTHSLQLAVLEYCKVSRTEDDLRTWAPGNYYELARNAIRPLIDGELLVSRGGKFRSRVSPKDPFERLVAVELKLKDVTRGLAQAHAYRLFADVSYLALPAYRINAAAMERARQIGVGLLAVHSGHVEEAVEPDIFSRATSGRRRMASEHTLLANSNASFRVAGAPPRR
jgi:hypothetical protein